MSQRRTVCGENMGSIFALWMIIILVFLAIATFMLRTHHSEPEPVVPLHNDGGRSLNLPLSYPPDTLTQPIFETCSTIS
jgi:hypothetical protein